MRSCRAHAWLAALAILGLVVVGCDQPTGEASGSPALGVRLTAHDLAFDQATLNVPAGVVIAITLDNQDPGILHDVAIFAAGADQPVFRSATFAGLASQTFALGPLAAGRYRFICDVHPNMTGSLVVGGG
ncbi:MAG: cupredoxin domain-containing protein [Candidatus Limnocylindrales bacterium]